MSNYPGHGEKFRKTSDIIIPRSKTFEDFAKPYQVPVSPEEWGEMIVKYWRKRMTKYRIVITEERVVKVKEKSYELLSDTGNDKDDGPVYGYVWSDGEETQKANVLDLTVDELNLQEILDAAMGTRRDEINLIGDEHED